MVVVVVVVRGGGGVVVGVVAVVVVVVVVVVVKVVVVVLMEHVLSMSRTALAVKRNVLSVNWPGLGIWVAWVRLGLVGIRWGWVVLG